MKNVYSNIRLSDEYGIGSTEDKKIIAVKINILGKINSEEKILATYKITYYTAYDKFQTNMSYFNNSLKNNKEVIELVKHLKKQNFIGENDPCDSGIYPGVERTCETCESNFKGVCADAYYNEKVKDIQSKIKKDYANNKGICSGWEIGLDAFSAWNQAFDEYKKKTRIIDINILNEQ